MAEQSGVREQLAQAGFEMKDAGANSFTLRKNTCAQTIVRDSTGTWRVVGPPKFIVRGFECELEDRGYQKFWYNEGKRFPIKQNDLKTLHAFDEEVRAILGLKSLYNESLGSTCARSVYDRVHGRPE